MTQTPSDAQQRAALLTNQGVAALRSGNREQALGLLRQAIQLDPQSEQAWLFMAGAVSEPERRKYCLERVLQINPQNELARRGLASLTPVAPPPQPEPPQPEPPQPAEASPGWAANPRSFAEVMQQRETRPKIEIPDLSTLDRPRGSEPSVRASEPKIAAQPVVPPISDPAGGAPQTQSQPEAVSGSGSLLKRRLPAGGSGAAAMADRPQIAVQAPGPRIDRRIVVGALIALVVIALVVIGVFLQPPAETSNSAATPQTAQEPTAVPPEPTAEPTPEATPEPTALPVAAEDLAAGIAALEEIERDRLPPEQRAAALNSALETFDRAVAAAPDDPRMYYYRGLTNWWLARTDEARNDLLDAADLFAEVIAQRPDDPEPAYLRGRAFFLLDEYAQSIEQMTRAIQLNAEFGEAYHQRARARYRVGDLEGCIADNIIAQQYLPDDALVYYRRGLAYLDLGDDERALVDYRKGLELDDQSGFSTDAHRIIAAILRRQGEFQAAVDEISIAIDRLPDELALRRERAELYIELDQIEAAEADIEAAANIDPNRPEIFYLRGRVAAAQREDMQAVEAYSAAIERNAEYAEAYEARGDAYIRLRQNQRALEDYRQAELLYARQNRDAELAAVQVKIQAIR